MTAAVSIAQLGQNNSSFVNRIINGAMVIDQRASGASTTPTAAGYYSCDRWYVELGAASKFSIQQNAGGVTPPAGFTNYIGITSTSAYSLSAGDYFYLSQNIEGYNVADTGWGTAAASPVTISFWVRSSLTGTFSVSLECSGNNQSYPATYTIGSANTWEYKTVTVLGTSGGTWNTTNGIGVKARWNLGTGATLSGTANTWSSGRALSATGATSVVSTNAATFYITGVQLEKGTAATSFDYRPYGTELALCQRYCVTFGNESNYQRLGWVLGGSGTTAVAQVSLPVVMRAIPSISYNSFGKFAVGTYVGGNFALTTSSLDSGASSTKNLNVNITVASGLSGGSMYTFNSNNVSDALLTISSEL